MSDYVDHWRALIAEGVRGRRWFSWSPAGGVDGARLNAALGTVLAEAKQVRDMHMRQAMENGAEVLRLREEVEELRMDAARYRFLRNDDSVGVYRIGACGAELDQMLDEAIGGRRSWPELGLK